MTAELRRSGHPMLATLLTVSLSGLAQAESPAAGPTNATDSAPHIDAIELIKEEESVSIAHAMNSRSRKLRRTST